MLLAGASSQSKYHAFATLNNANDNWPDRQNIQLVDQDIGTVLPVTLYRVQNQVLPNHHQLQFRHHLKRCLPKTKWKTLVVADEL